MKTMDKKNLKEVKESDRSKNESLLKEMCEVMERIYCAAIWYKEMPTPKYNPKNIEKGLVVEGHRHADVIRTMVNLLGKRTCTNGEDCAGESIQGFVTNTHRFVDRYEGMKIAREANQIISDTTFKELYSEDLY
jgi:hypothetical protein